MGTIRDGIQASYQKQRSKAFLHPPFKVQCGYPHAVIGGSGEAVAHCGDYRHAELIAILLNRHAEELATNHPIVAKTETSGNVQWSVGWENKTP
jgi:hypothetical protein